MRRCLERRQVTLIPGVELTALYQWHEVHILAFDFVPTAMHEILKKREHIVALAKRREMNTARRLFARAGFVVDDRLQPLPNEPVGLTIARNVYVNQQNQAYLRARHGRRLSPTEFFTEYQAFDKPCYTRRSGVSVQWIIRHLRGTAADLIIAHPFVAVSVFVPRLGWQDLERLIDMGLTGVEVFHNKTPAGTVRSLLKMARQRRIHYTGGSDFHGRRGDVPLGFYGRSRVPSYKLTNFSHAL
ncbi:MAG: PHP domain protein [Parcubacteria group bacterium Gr01-1014_38]|nr:MAG: PHP domain protein [Parcubacteria group bacterium Gr01-1014_38]